MIIDYVPNNIIANNIKTKLVSNNIKIKPNTRLNNRTQKILSVICTLFSVNLLNCECFWPLKLSRKQFYFCLVKPCDCTKGSFSIFWYFATEWMLQNLTSSPFSHFFWPCDVVQNSDFFWNFDVSRVALFFWYFATGKMLKIPKRSLPSFTFLALWDCSKFSILVWH